MDEEFRGLLDSVQTLLYNSTVATTPSVKIVKEFPYRGDTVRWSNRYHFSGGTPSTDANWHTLMDAVVAAEHPCLVAACVIVEAIGYAAGSDVPVSSKTYSQAGTLSLSAGKHRLPGDCAVLVRYATAARSSKNHPVYLFNYYHGATWDDSDPVDDVWSDQLTALDTYATAWIAGFSDSVNTLKRAGPNGATATGYYVDYRVTHRDFPR